MYRKAIVDDLQNIYIKPIHIHTHTQTLYVHIILKHPFLHTVGSKSLSPLPRTEHFNVKKYATNKNVPLLKAPYSNELA